MMGLKHIIEEKHSGDNEQLDFIFSKDQRMIITAPAGCGKTTTMVSKIAWELSQGNVPVNKKILAMTFSVSAATKIKDALNDLLPNLIEQWKRELSKVEVSNYHNLATKLLYNHGYFIDQELVNLSQFKIVSEYDDVLNSYLITSQRDSLYDFDEAVKNLHYTEVKNLTEVYIDILLNNLFPNHIITYNGLLLCAIKLLDIDSIRNFYRQYYRIIIVDEFQDTSYLSFLLINKLIGNNKTFLLGDDIQKIYGFLGAMNNIFTGYAQHYNMREIEFLNNYRFAQNPQMKQLDKFIRGYGVIYAPSMEKAKINMKILNSDEEEDFFILKGVKKIISNSKDRIAILVRAGYQADLIIDLFKKNDIAYFNAIFNDSDSEYVTFHRIALESLIVNAKDNRATKSILKKCKSDIINNKKIICPNQQREFIFESLYRLLDALFTHSLDWCCSLQERYEKITFILNNNSLKHMMEYIDKPVFITTIHSAKGLEWEYVIMPKLISGQFPSYRGVCRQCIRCGSRNEGCNYCLFTFDDNMIKKFNEEISVFYVGITRAKKNLYITANTGINQRGFNNRTSCLINLPGLKCEDFDW